MKKQVKSFGLSAEAVSALTSLADRYPIFTKNQIAELSLIECAKWGLFREEVTGSKSKAGAPSLVLEDRATWCKEVGGEVRSGCCEAIAYNQSINGQVSTLRESIPLKELPATRSEFHRYFLDSFSSVTEAEVAVEKQLAEDRKRALQAADTMENYTEQAIEEEEKETEADRKVTEQVRRDQKKQGVTQKSGKAMLEELEQLQKRVAGGRV